MSASGAVRGFAANKLVEVAALASGRGVLNDECQTALVEFLQPVIPRNRLKRAFTGITGKIDTENSEISSAAGTLHTGWLSAALFYPTADLFMISEDAIAC